MKQARILITGGFLGAGKTTLLWEAAQLLAKKGKSVGLTLEQYQAENENKEAFHNLNRRHSRSRKT